MKAGMKDWDVTFNLSRIRISPLKVLFSIFHLSQQQTVITSQCDNKHSTLQSFTRESNILGHMSHCCQIKGLIKHLLTHFKIHLKALKMSQKQFPGLMSQLHHQSTFHHQSIVSGKTNHQINHIYHSLYNFLEPESLEMKGEKNNL